MHLCTVAFQLLTCLPFTNSELGKSLWLSLPLFLAPQLGMMGDKGKLETTHVYSFWSGGDKITHVQS